MPVETSTAIILVGGVLCPILVRLVRGSRYLTVILLASYSLRVALTLGFYLVSAYQIPIFRSLQLPDGFWKIANDAPYYHVIAVGIAEALERGTDFPQTNLEAIDFFLFVGLVYRGFGVHPLYVPLLNTMLWPAIAVLGYAMARRIKGENAGPLAAILISFWPSPFFWSSQILKDTLVIFLLLSALFLCILTLGERRRFWLASVVLLIPVIFLLTRLRYYLIPIILLAITGVVVSALVRPSSFWQPGSGVRGVVLIGIILGSFGVALTVNPVVLLSPARPDPGHLGKAQDSQAPGDRVAAVRDEPQRALERSLRPAEAELQVSKEAPRPESRRSAPFLKLVVQRGVRVLSQAFTLQGIAGLRKGFATTGGASNVGEDIKIEGFWSMIAFLPRGLAYSVFAPFPWQWFSMVGETGVFRLLSGVEVLLILGMGSFLLVAVIAAVRSRRPDAWLLFIFSAMTAILHGLVVTNIGTLFRLRLQFLIPMLVILAAYGPIDRWRAVYGLLVRRFRRPRGMDSTLGLHRDAP